MKRIISLLFIAFSLSLNAQIPDGYYDSAIGLQGEALKAALHNIIKGHTTYPYTDSGTDVWDILKETDRDPNNPNNVILIYTGFSVDAAQEYNNGNGWTREHVWAKSHGDFDIYPPAGTDAHHLRPANNSVNTARSDKDFDNGGTPNSIATECYSTTDTWEPRDAVKGDIARMMFYMATRYEGDVAGEPDLELVDHITSYPDPVFGVLSTLLEWNEQDPVDDFERNRNEVVYSYQHNRNPFIDHPEFVNAIYNPEEDTTSTTGINDLNIASIKIYPNPVLNQLNISTSENYKFEVFSVTGEKIISTENKTINTQDWKPGVYFIIIKNENGLSVKSEKIIKN